MYTIKVFVEKKPKLRLLYRLRLVLLLSRMFQLVLRNRTAYYLLIT